MVKVNQKLLMMSVSTAAALTFYNIVPGQVTAEEVTKQLAEQNIEDTTETESNEPTPSAEDITARKDDDTDTNDENELDDEEDNDNNQEESQHETEEEFIFDSENDIDEQETAIEDQEENDQELEETTIQTFSKALATKVQEDNTIKLGDSGEAVSKLQNDLKKLGFFVGKNLSGVFDTVTVEEIKSFQAYYNLNITGEADTKTIEKINSILNSPFSDGNRHQDTVTLKINMSTLGFHVSNNPTTLYGSSTADQVRSLQQYYGLRVNGIADEVTMSKINSIIDSPFRNGIRHQETIQLKENLSFLGFHISDNPTTLYGSSTERKVRNFQSYHGLVVNGIADSVTLAKINELLQAPMQNGLYRNDVITLKINLATLGFTVSNNPTPLYGSTTEQVVKDFQRYYGLNVTGVADNSTLKKIDDVLNSPLRNGERHESAIKLKEDLSFLGFHVSDTPTTLYGASTEAKVKEFQAYHGLRESGIADSVTLAKINELLQAPLQNGLYRSDVITLKVNLANIGFPVSENPTPLFGSSTEQVVKDFQRYYGLNVTGVADNNTLKKIEDILNSPLRNGQRHESAIKLKEDLSFFGFHISDNPTTLYGASTEAKVKEFQSYYGLIANGIADEVTLRKIEEIISSPFQNGVRHDGTIQLKEDLSKIGFHISDNPTTLYGSSTEATVRDFQLYYGLVVNGIADSVTFSKIEEILSSPFQSGQRHDNTVKLKEDLSLLGFHISNNPTTLYGSSTESTVRDFQSYYGLRVNGIADEVTFVKIAEILSSPFQNGRRHSGTIKLKEDLAKLGYFISSNPTNLYGSSTETIVRQFQRNNSLRVNGIADEVTLALIEELSKNISKETITYTQYNVTLKEAIQRQSQLNPPPQTDKYRNAPAYLHSSVVKIVEGITTGNVNLRYEATTNSDRLRLAYTNTTLNITGEVQGQSINGNTLWYQINFNGTTVYASAEYVRPTKVATTVTSNVREATNTSSHVFARVSSNSHYTINRVITGGSSVSGSRVWYDISLGTWRNAKVSDFESYIDPNQNDIYQHLVLDSYAGATAKQLNTVLKGKGVLDGMGAAFVEASRTHSVNEIYLISHAILETGHGTSKLATGIEVGKNSRGDLVLVTSSNRSSLTNIKTTYNMFGIGAADSDPYGLGAKYAYNAGWFTPEAAIIGGAQFIYSGYMSRGQNTLYKMRWNFAYPTSTGFLPQYATDMGWAVKQVSNIKNLYQLIENAPKKFDIVQYK